MSEAGGLSEALAAQLTRAHPGAAPALIDVSAASAALLIDLIGEALGAGPTRAGWARVALEAWESAAEAADEAGALRPVACQRGCHWCCHIKVVCTIAEVFVVSEAIDALPVGLRAATRARVAASAARARARPEAEGRPPEACPLLVERACQVHAARPLVCRGLTSLDAGACQREHEAARRGERLGAAVPHEVTLEVIASAFGLALEQAARDAGLSVGLVDLHVALDVVQREPAALARWLGGEALFDDARRVAEAG